MEVQMCVCVCVCVCVCNVIMISFPLDTYPEMGFLILGGTSILLSIVAMPVYILTNCIQEFLFLHIHIRICYFFSFWQ